MELRNRRGAVGFDLVLALAGILVAISAYVLLNNVKIPNARSAHQQGTVALSVTPNVPARAPSSTPSSTLGSGGTSSTASSSVLKFPSAPEATSSRRLVPAVIPQPASTPIVLPHVVPPPAPIVTSSAPVGDQPTVSQLPSIIQIDSQVLVGVLCYFHAAYTDQVTGKTVVDDQLTEDRGSGVLIGSRGYVLTNRHVIEPAQDKTTITNESGIALTITIDYRMDHCEVGQLPKATTLPTAGEIRAFNPFVQIPVLGYVAQPIFVPSSTGRSAVEVQAADFAILKITGVSQSGPTFGITSVPASFPYAKLLPIDQVDLAGEQVVTYGFPGDVTAGQRNTFETLTMTGSVGTVTEVEVGDAFYRDTPLIITANMDVAHGRSGSPLFWRGYVIGIVTYYTGNNRTDSGSVASDAVLKTLQGTTYYGN